MPIRNLSTWERESLKGKTIHGVGQLFCIVSVDGQRGRDKNNASQNITISN
jgi:hypothetical protein